MMSKKVFPIALLLLILLNGIKIGCILRGAVEYLLYLDFFACICFVIFFILLKELLSNTRESAYERIFILYHLLLINALIPGYVDPEFLPPIHLEFIAFIGSAILFMLAFLYVREQRKIHLLNFGLFLFLNASFLLGLL